MYENIRIVFKSFSLMRVPKSQVLNVARKYTYPNL